VRPLVVTVVGFPLGANLSASKAAEARAVIDAGADEVDMVLSIGRLKAGESSAVVDDIAAVVSAAGGKPVKVILETSLLMKQTVGGRLRIKASGGIRDAAGARALVAAGADVLGCSASVVILGG
jgi:deoxyribose-phosphate aldolase